MGFLNDIGVTKKPEAGAKQKMDQTDAAIAEQLKELGTLVYTQYKDRLAGEAAYDGQVAAIDALYVQKKEHYDEWLKIQGLMECAHCKEKITYGSVFCNFCGNRVDNQIKQAEPEAVVQEDPVQEAAVQETVVQEATEGLRACPTCGVQVTANDGFCPQCGSQIK